MRVDRAELAALVKSMVAGCCPFSRYVNTTERRDPSLQGLTHISAFRYVASFVQLSDTFDGTR
jgi:hypothetical protein